MLHFILFYRLKECSSIYYFFLQNLVGNVIGNRMEAVLVDDMEVDQEIVVI